MKRRPVGITILAISIVLLCGGVGPSWGQRSVIRTKRPVRMVPRFLPPDDSTKIVSPELSLGPDFSGIATNDALREIHAWFFAEGETGATPRSLHDLDTLLSGYLARIREHVKEKLEEAGGDRLVFKGYKEGGRFEFSTNEDFVYPSKVVQPGPRAHGPGLITVVIRPIRTNFSSSPSAYHGGQRMEVWELHTEITLISFTKEYPELSYEAQCIIEDSLSELFRMADSIDLDRVKQACRQELLRRDRPSPQIVRALSYLRDDPSLLELLAQYETKDVGDTIWHFGRARCKEAVPLLLEIAEGSGSRQDAAIGALGKIGDERAIPCLVRLARSPDAHVSVPAVKALVSFDDPRAVKEVLQCDARFQHTILMAAIHSRPLSAEYVPLLRSILAKETEHESENTMYSLWALANTGSDDARATVLAHAEKGNHHAVSHLGGFPSPETVDYLISVLHEEPDASGNISRQGAAGRALAKMPSLAVPPLLHMLRTESGNPFMFAMGAMRTLFRFRSEVPTTRSFCDTRRSYRYPHIQYRPDGAAIGVDVAIESNRLRIAEAWAAWWRSEQAKDGED